MHLALIIYGSLNTLSGGYLYDRKLVEHLRRQGDRVEVISLPWRGYLRHLGDNFSPALRRRLSHANVDLLVQDELNHPSLFWLNQRLRSQADYPLVSIVHHLRSNEPRPNWQNWLYRRIERDYLNSLDAFVYNSHTTRQVVASLTTNKHPYIVAHPAGDRLNPEITDEEIAHRARQSGPLRLFFLGNLIPRKGLHVLIAALSRLPPGRWHLTVGGDLSADRSYTARVMQKVKIHGLNDRVDFLGPLNSSAIAEHLCTSHLLTLPSYYEGFGIAYLEGMSFGLPAVATTAGAAHEIISHGENGFLVPPGDSRMLADCLEVVINDRERLVTMSLKARQRYLTHPTWEQTMHRVREFFLTLI